MKKCVPAIIMLMMSLCAQAVQQAYVTDKLEVQMRSGRSLQHKILKMLPSGTPLTALETDENTGYTRVTLESGEQGWVLTRYLTTEPVGRMQLEQLGEENKALKNELAALKIAKDSAEKSGRDMNTELIAIRHASANAIQIQAERDQLQEKVIDLERELETTRREKQALDDDIKQDWFLIGAGVLFGGMLLGLILPRLSWRKRDSWNSF
ncbi:MAG TPA: TIGR04211 family SH3 domain-containing protein [Methylococcaceae bacterium]|nr:TIGR04211 family SH3 domain-containing protein [Methylococcaceae bacterium]